MVDWPFIDSYFIGICKGMVSGWLMLLNGSCHWIIDLVQPSEKGMLKWIQRWWCKFVLDGLVPWTWPSLYINGSNHRNACGRATRAIVKIRFFSMDHASFDHFVASAGVYVSLLMLYSVFFPSQKIVNDGWLMGGGQCFEPISTCWLVGKIFLSNGICFYPLTLMIGKSHGSDGCSLQLVWDWRCNIDPAGKIHQRTPTIQEETRMKGSGQWKAWLVDGVAPNQDDRPQFQQLVIAINLEKHPLIALVV